MQRFGFSLLLICFFIFSAVPAGCAGKSYDEKEMGRLATFVRVVMDIVSSEYDDKPVPKLIKKEQLRKIIIKANTDFEELELLDKYGMIIVSDGKEMGAVVWDPKTNRKLIQDLRCTAKVDDPAWRKTVTGNDFTLDWGICAH
jgi:hypothetical protein